METRILLTRLPTLVTFHSRLLSCYTRGTAFSQRIVMASNNNRLSPINTQAKPAKRTNSYEKSYKNSIKTLNALQTNSQVLASLVQNRAQTEANLSETIVYLERGGLSLEQLDSVNVIHVSGTKGKGTTCAFVESILRQAGLRTGFFSSPHLVAVRERIRINGKPLSEPKFSQYFFDVYESMNKRKVSENDMPAYFRFLTCMAYYVFFHEKVDVAIMEVGIGGTYDSTNIVRKPKVVGITSLGLDHQNVLGNTLEEISAQKAGIMKQNVPAVTTHNHPPEVWEILRTRAESVGCTIHTAPPLQNYDETIKLGVDDGQVSRINAGLAIQLANVFLNQCFPSKLNCENSLKGSQGGNEFQIGKVCQLQKWHLEGLQNCTWHGRFEVLKQKENLCYYLDGAHTEESLVAARNWFLKMTRKDSLRVLVFYITGNRDAEKLMKPFVNGSFDLLLLCPLVISSSNNYKANADNWSTIRSDEFSNCQMLAAVWEKLHDVNMNRTSSKAIILNSVQAVLQYLENLSTAENLNGAGTEFVPSQSYHNVNVLFTGSLHMVGNFLSVLDPQISE